MSKLTKRGFLGLLTVLFPLWGLFQKFIIGTSLAYDFLTTIFLGFYFLSLSLSFSGITLALIVSFKGSFASRPNCPARAPNRP